MFRPDLSQSLHKLHYKCLWLSDRIINVDYLGLWFAGCVFGVLFLGVSAVYTYAELAHTHTELAHTRLQLDIARQKLVQLDSRTQALMESVATTQRDTEQVVSAVTKVANAVNAQTDALKLIATQQALNANERQARSSLVTPNLHVNAANVQPASLLREPPAQVSTREQDKPAPQTQPRRWYFLWLR